MSQEVVLLVEPDGPACEKIRPVILSRSVPRIVERCHVTKDEMWVRTWICTNDERALTGQRIFREQLPPPPKDEPEKPLFDELVVKSLPFTATETPLGWQRGPYSKEALQAIAADPLQKTR